MPPRDGPRNTSSMSLISRWPAIHWTLGWRVLHRSGENGTCQEFLGWGQGGHLYPLPHLYVVVVVVVL